MTEIDPTTLALIEEVLTYLVSGFGGFLMGLAVAVPKDKPEPTP